MFGDVILQRATSNNSVTQYQKVPLNYGPGEKYLTRTEEDLTLDKSIAIQYPRMSYEMNGYYYDGTRALNRTQVITFNNSSIYVVPVPYNFVFSLSVETRNQEDLWKILEQILPYFAPNFTVKADMLDNGYLHDIIFDINQQDLKEIYEGRFQDRRENGTTLTFTCKGWLFGPNKATLAGTKPIKWVTTTEHIWGGVSSIPGNIDFTSANTYVYEANTAIGDIQPTDNYTIITTVAERVT